jgi:hypothetical protein
MAPVLGTPISDTENLLMISMADAHLLACEIFQVDCSE